MEANLEITLPVPPVQAIPQANRVVVVAGSKADDTHTLDAASRGPIAIQVASIDAKVTVSVAEVLSNGRKSAPCEISFTALEHVEAVSADPTGFAVKVVSIGGPTL